MEWYLTVLKKYAVFSGRARRKEYWMFTLFNLIFSFVAGFLDTILVNVEDVIYFLYSLVVLLPGLAVTVRRLHDTGRSGWFILLSLVPIIGQIWLLVLLCMDSQPGTNKYGPNPKEWGEQSSYNLNDTDIEMLRKLAELKDRGVITEDEFAEKKSKILNRN